MNGARTRPFWILILLLILAHFLLHLGIGIWEGVPDLLTIAVLLAARRLSPPAAALLGLLLGVLQDAFSLVAFGASAVVLTVVGFLGSRTRDLFVGDSFIFLGAYLFLGKWLRDALYFLVGGRFAADALGDVLLVRIPLLALYTMAVGLVIVLLYRNVTGDR